MEVEFHKYQGTGNDFIMVDNRRGEFVPDVQTVVRMCDRRFGIGSDGLILIEPGQDADFYMNFFNPDGSKSFCGNGSRCAVRFAQKLGIVGRSGRFGAIDMVHFFESDDVEVRIKMRDVAQIERLGEDQMINTGSPHYLVFTEEPEGLDIVKEAKKIRYSDRFAADGINVNFIREGEKEIWMRTYERGVEDETLSCGTGVTAAAIGFASRKGLSDQVMVHTRGGNLSVRFNRSTDHGFENVWLCGPADFVFEGRFVVRP